MVREAVSVGITLNEDAQLSAPSSVRRLALVVMQDDGLSRYELCSGQSLRIGRAETCEIIVRDPLASRLHALLHVHEAVEVEDAGSHNGTRVHNQRLEPNRRVLIRIGEPIQIGNTVLMLQTAPPARSPSDSGVRALTALEHGIVISDPSMHATYDFVRRVAASNITVLIVGETGVGKEVIAERIHKDSGRSGQFVRINCAAVSESLFESELFGHERGSFTGAMRSKAGLLEMAEQGTAFLDEVGEVPLAMQAKLLRALESREVTRVGGLKSRSIDVRFVAATNRDLRAEVARGRFREDLFFRLNGAIVSVPPLRARGAEIEPLIDEFMSSMAAELERPVPRLSAEALAVLKAHSWPGNIRELRNAVQSAVLRSINGSVSVDDLPVEVRPPASGARQTVLPVPIEGDTPDRLNSIQRLERERIVDALRACNGNQTRAAEYLCMPRRTLVTKLALYGIPRPRKLTPAPGA